MRNRHPELLIPASSLEVLKTAVMFWCRCSIYRRRGIWTSCKGKEFLYGRHERRRAVCA